MRWLCLVVVCLVIACGASGGGSYSADDAAADVAPSTPWVGSYVATIAGVLSVGAVTRNAPGSDSIVITQDGSRVTWTREGDCRVTWTATGDSAVADIAQQCAFTVGGSVVALRLEMGAASIAGPVIMATLRWSTVGSGGTYVETITATRR